MTLPLNLDDYEHAAREVLPPAYFDWIAGGAEDETTLAENRAAFRRRKLLHRVLREVRDRDLSRELLRARLPFPIVLAPTALHQLAHPQGEAATATAAASLGALWVESTSASATMEDVEASAPAGPRWFQLYQLGGRPGTLDLIERARAIGFGALVVTVDLPLLGRRERDLRNDFALPPGVRLVNEPVDARASESLPTLEWADLEWIRDAWRGPLVLKGIVRGDDAERALAHGVEAIWVSNHGGRQLDGGIATLDALPGVVAAVRGRVPVIVDGGVRRGTDVVKALALGAAAVAIGRPYLYGLAVAGDGGVRAVLELLRDELSLAMALCGCRELADITSDLVR